MLLNGALLLFTLQLEEILPCGILFIGGPQAFALPPSLALLNTSLLVTSAEASAQT